MAIFSFDTPLELILYAKKDLNTLRGTSDSLRKGMSQLDSIRDVQNSMRAGVPRIQIQYDRELLRQYNLSTTNAAQMVKSKVQGQKASTLSFGDERIDLTVRLMGTRSPKHRQIEKYQYQSNNYASDSTLICCNLF